MIESRWLFHKQDQHSFATFAGLFGKRATRLADNLLRPVADENLPLISLVAMYHS